MTVKFTNNASTTVATGINTTATSLVVASAAGFPALSGSGDYCYLTIQQAAGTNVEVVKATALSSNTFTIVRAQDGTSAGSWSVSDVVELRVTAALLTDIVDAATHDSSVLAVDSTNNRVGVNDTTPSVTLDISGTDAIALPVGTTAERPTGAAGRFRYNSSLSQFEGYTDAWGAIGGGGTNTFTTDTFTANGSLVAFNLSQTVASANNLLCFIDGVFQTQDAYAIATASGTTTLTFSAAPANARKIVVYSVAAGISGSNLNIDSMTGDGSDVTLTLSIAPVTINNTIVTIDGVYQSKSNYSISGTTLTFSTAPPTGSAVEVMTFTQTDINVPVDGTITSAKLSGDLTTPGALTVTGQTIISSDALVSTPSTYYDDIVVQNSASGTGAGMTVLVNATNGFGGLKFGDSTNSNQFGIGFDANANAGFLDVLGAQALTIDSNRNVGIGQSNPTSPNDATDFIHIGSATNQDTSIVLQDAVETWEIYQNDDLSFLFDTTNVMTLQRLTGNVGIGSAAPTQTQVGSVAPKLHVKADGTVGSYDLVARFEAGNDSSQTGASILINHSNDRGLLIEGGRDTGGDISVGHLGVTNSAGTNTRAITILAAGQVTMPKQPSFQARLNSNQTGFNPTNFGLAVGFNVTDHNVGNHFNTSTGLFTAPVAGLYFFEAATFLNTNVTQSWYVKNGSRVNTTDKMVGAGPAFPDNNTVLLLAANDTVGFHPYVASNTNVTVINNANHTYFKGYLIG